MSRSPHDAALPARIAAWVRSVAPARVAVAVDRVGPAAAFDAAEAAVVARAGAGRRDTFATGRRLARAALAELGAMPGSLPADDDGVPRWPAGFMGSISHADGLCIAVAGQAGDLAGIGVDLERAERVVPALARRICRVDESNPGDAAVLALRFAAKEAVFKAYFLSTRCRLGFQDVHVAIAPASDRFEARLACAARPALGTRRAFDGRLARFGHHVVAGVCVAR